MQHQHSIRISYGANDADHSTYVVFVPLDDGDFPFALRKAVETAGDILLRAIAHDVYRPDRD